VKSFRQQKRPRKSSLIAGPEAVRESLLADVPLERIYLQFGRQYDEIRLLASQKRVPVNQVPEAKLNSFHVPDHGGCIALKARVRYYELDDVIHSVQARGETPLLLILDGITDVRNIGGIARTAYCTGVHALIIPDKGVGALNEDAVLTSAGALEKIMISRVDSLVKAAEQLRMNGITILASVMDSDTAIADCDLSEPLAIVLGSEDKGISPVVLKVANGRFTIPMQREFDSLNVSVAAGMILYETMKQRNHG